MSPNPPEEFETSIPTLEIMETSSTPTYYPRHYNPKSTSSKIRPTIPYNTTIEPPSQLNKNKPIVSNNIHTRNFSADDSKSIIDDGPRIDTNYIIRGYQQRQGPTRKRSSTASGQSFLQTNLKNGQIGQSRQSIDFLQSYRANGLLKGKTNPINLPDSHASSPNGTKAQISNLLSFLFDSISLDTLKFIVYCLLWYASSAVTSNIGKQILNQFRYPITLTWIQFGFVVFYCYGFAQIFGLTKIKSPSKNILLEVLPLSLFQIAGHVFSSFATSHVPVSFVHTVKALSPLFTVLLYRFLFRVNYSSAVYVSLLPLTVGVMLACSSHSTSNFIGFLFAIGSTLIFVAQNIFSKKLLFNQDRGPTRKKLDKLNLLFYSSTFAFTLMTPMWVYYDGLHLFAEYLWPTQIHHVHPSTVTNGWIVAFYFLLNGTTHFAQNILAFSILAITSPVTYSIASLVKRIFVITASIIWFGQGTTLVQVLGICLTFTGLYMYNKAKRDVDRKERKAQEAGEIVLPLARSE